MDNIFGEVISTYTRAQALADGVLVDVSTTAKEAGIKFPVAITQALYHGVIAPDPRAVGQDVDGRLWDALYMLRNEIRRGNGGAVVVYRCYFVMKARQRRLMTLKAVCGPGDNAEPVITIMLPDED